MMIGPVFHWLIVPHLTYYGAWMFLIAVLSGCVAHESRTCATVGDELVCVSVEPPDHIEGR